MGDNAMFEAENKYNENRKAFIVEAAVQAELDMLRDIIINTIPVEQIILFGSYAYGTPHKDSDLDLYVVMKDEVSMRNIDASLEIYHAISRKKSMPVDIVVNKSSAFAHRKANPTLERQIASEGIVLYG
jgi:predicted nucleotidyltransferase